MRDVAKMGRKPARIGPKRPDACQHDARVPKSCAGLTAILLSRCPTISADAYSTVHTCANNCANSFLVRPPFAESDEPIQELCRCTTCQNKMRKPNPESHPGLPKVMKHRSAHEASLIRSHPLSPEKRCSLNICVSFLIAIQRA